MEEKDLIFNLFIMYFYGFCPYDEVSYDIYKKGRLFKIAKDCFPFNEIHKESTYYNLYTFNSRILMPKYNYIAEE